MGHWAWDIASDSLALSPEAAAIFESSVAPRALADWLALFHPEDRAHVQSQFDLARERRRLRPRG